MKANLDSKKRIAILLKKLAEDPSTRTFDGIDALQSIISGINHFDEAIDAIEKVESEELKDEIKSIFRQALQERENI